MAKLKKTNTLKSWLQQRAVDVSRIHFYFIALFVFYIILSDAWKLVTNDVLLQRWTIAFCMLIINVALWFVAHNNWDRALPYRLSLWGFVTVDIVVTSVLIYSQRGMASRAAFLYVIPIVISALLLSRRALFGTAALSVGAYVFTAVRYFILHPSEGYRAELYTEVGFYAACLFVISALLWSFAHPRKTDT